MNNKVYLKNMVCPRCIDAVRVIFDELNIEVYSIQLGEVTVIKHINKKKTELLQNLLLEKGFGLLEDNKAKLIGKIKSIIINEIHHLREPIDTNFSTLLRNKLNHDYSYLSRLFSSVEGMTIEKFILSQKIEKVKELLFYNELTLSEISFQLGYSSVAHISSQFKKETGMTTTEFKNQKKPGHRYLDSI